MPSLAVMQPYFLPYLGYWQLLHSVDRFVIYDDVNYIKGGWINRNRILIAGEAKHITVPLLGASSYKKIREIELAPVAAWADKMIRTVELNYRRTPYFHDVFPVLVDIILCPARNLADYLRHQLTILANYMNITTDIVLTSSVYKNHSLSGQDRVLDICRREGATDYINAIGGKALYDGARFSSFGVDLFFISPELNSYNQTVPGFIPGLSIMDLLMELGPAQVHDHLNAYRLIRA